MRTAACQGASDAVLVSMKAGEVQSGRQASMELSNLKHMLARASVSPVVRGGVRRKKRLNN